ncbi:MULTISPECIES: gas vesicle protein GvpO [Streptomyces]|uniref:Gas vesicle synthesis protein n=1 Tax=Streptomyces venezuelae (strain ATCC 10712 / CBS 650.69 / DSM 40230 / JCM 4526 / NBRC 13096 / PD 04745) TaxID=953739 RepID=F2R6Y4_STRVP|nr:gas vesicle protein [Streptomyces venezuelae]APE19862.1 gas vesicle protein [Streptomyces venezuelae]QER97273.1 gas vesicle protein [Streptomyces venezuelae ATCC 10712]QES04462.1 gas vesicle protein [Streptomyces venezuelae]CCA53676.1 gas vesicle synthesis protein [Streptomyces venezuelae ATCC 10712]
MSATDDDKNETSEKLDIATAMRRASAQLSELLRCEPGSVSAVKATEDGWAAEVEVVELEKVPDTMSVMASYRVALDTEGRLVAYERTRRYARGQIDRR